MLKTTKYEFGKPEQNDFYDINVHNNNMDEIERALTEFDDSGKAEGITSFTDIDITITIIIGANGDNTVK